MINKSIAYRLSIYISLAVVAVFLAFIIIAYIFNSNILKSNIETRASGLSYQAMMIGENQLASTREITSNIAELALYFAQDDEVEFLVSKLMSKYHFLNAVHINIDSVIPNVLFHNYLSYREGDSIFFEKQNEIMYGCKNEERIAKKIITTSKAGWTEVFSCSRNKNHVVSYHSPITILDSNKKPIIIGSVITELSLQDLSDAINSLKIGESGYVILVSQDGDYLTHPRKEWVLKKNLADISKKEYVATKEEIKNLLANGISGSVTAYPEYMNYEKCWVHYSRIAETGWTLIFVVPYNELFVPLYLLILRMLFFSVLGILVIFFIVTYVSNKLIQPLSTVTSQLKKFSSTNGDFDLNTRNEVKLVSDSLVYLQTWYEKFKIDQNIEEKLKSQSKQDLVEASEIQMSLINTDFKVFSKRNDVNLYAVYKPARIVSGDLYDFIFLEDDFLFFSIGDVSGKGISAAFFMSIAQTLLKSNAKLKLPENIVNKANNEIFTANQHQFFVTLFVGVLNLKTGELQYCNAAHTPTLILNSQGNITELSETHGMPLGLYPNRVYHKSMVMLNQGDSIILYSDGVTEHLNTANELYGTNRFIQKLEKISDRSPKNLIEEVMRDLELFGENMKQTDDITMMVVQYKKKEA